MAGLKKTKKDGSSPNMVLIVFLIFFVLVSIGLGVFAYYGVDNLEKAKAAEKNMRAQVELFKAERDQWKFYAFEASGPVGITPLSPEAKNDYDAAYKGFTADPTRFKDVDKWVKEVRKKNADMLGTFSEVELKYPTTYSEKVKAAVDDANESKSKLAALNAEFDDFKKNYDDFVANYQTQLTKLQDEIKAGSNAAALKQAKVTNDKFPILQKAYDVLKDDKQKEFEEHDKDVKKLSKAIGKANIDLAAAKKRLDDRTLGLAIGGGGTGDTRLHALMLDISRGSPLWDRPLGKIIRIDPSNLMVFIDVGTQRGITAEMTFQVFAGTPQGKADRQLKGTLEVIRVIDENTSACRITSMFNDRGETIALGTPEARTRALRDTDSMFREGDLLFNTFFDSHIAIVGNVSFTRIGQESPATQQMQLEEFTQLLRKQHIYVDAYVNLLNAKFEGTLTPRTRLLVRGDISALSSTADEKTRVDALNAAYVELEKQAISGGMFVISAENFAAVIGYRPPQAQTARDVSIGFRPLQPFVANDRTQRGPAIGGPPPMPMADPPPGRGEEDGVIRVPCPRLCVVPCGHAFWP